MKRVALAVCMLFFMVGLVYAGDYKMTKRLEPIRYKYQ